DWAFPLWCLIPLGNQTGLYEGPYLRCGGSRVGATFARAKDGGNFVRFGLFAGGGYELNVSRALTGRVFAARLSFDMGTRRAMDRQGHWVDLGLQLGTGIVFRSPRSATPHVTAARRASLLGGRPLRSRCFFGDGSS